MSIAIERWVLAALLASGTAGATEAPRDLLADGAGLERAFADAIGRPVFVLEANYGPHYVEMTVQDAADPEIYDEYSVTPGAAVSKPKALKVGDVDCKKQKIPLAQLSFEGAARALADAEAIANGNGFKFPGTIHFGPNVFCKELSWRSMMTAPDNTDDGLELLYGQDGKLATARRIVDGRWKKLDLGALKRGEVAALPAPPPSNAAYAAPDGGKRNFRANPLEALALLEATLGGSLKLLDLDFDVDRATFQLLDPQNRKRVLTYFVHADGKVEQWRADDTWSVVCAKPIVATELPIALLPELERRALVSIPAMSRPTAEDVRIRRSGLCGAPRVYVTLEDERATGDVEFDAKGKLIEARVR